MRCAGLSPLVPQNPKALSHMTRNKQVITPGLLGSPRQGKKTGLKTNLSSPFHSLRHPASAVPCVSGTHFVLAIGTLRGAALSCLLAATM